MCHTHTHTHTHTQETMVLERIGSLLGDETYLLSVTKDLLAELKVSACQEAALIVMEELPMLTSDSDGGDAYAQRVIEELPMR